MLKKLLKHEFKATGRFFLPAYGTFAALLVVERMSLLSLEYLSNMGGIVGSIVSILTTLITALTVIAIFALILCPVIYAVVRFNRNMLGDEGYLMNTLPVTASQQIWAKLLAAATWGAVTVIVISLLGCLFLATMDPKMVGECFRAIGTIFSEGFRLVGAWMIFLPLLILANLLVQMGYNYLALYSAMGIGQTANKHKLLASAGAYLGIQFGTSMVLQSLAMGLILTSGKQWTAELDLLFRSMNSAAEVGQKGCLILCTFLLVAILINGMLGAVHFFLSRYFLSKKLNLA